MGNNFFDKGSRYSEFKDSKSILSAFEEIARTKDISLDLKGDSSVDDIASSLGVETADLLLIINEKSGTLPLFLSAHPEYAPKAPVAEGRPDWMNGKMSELDVRNSIAKGVDPFGIIMKAVSDLRGEILHLINVFEPVPLYSALGRKGFEHFSEQKDGVWHIYFFNTGVKQQTQPQGFFHPHQEEQGKNTVDVRGLEPPQPMVKILEALADLPENETLLVHHFRRPKHLYPKLEEKGYTVETEEAGTDHIILRIHK